MIAIPAAAAAGAATTAGMHVAGCRGYDIKLIVVYVLLVVCDGYSEQLATLTYKELHKLSVVCGMPLGPAGRRAACPGQLGRHGQSHTYAVHTYKCPTHLLGASDCMPGIYTCRAKSRSEL